MYITKSLREKYIRARKEKNPDSEIYSYYLSVALKVEKDGGAEKEIIKEFQKAIKELKDNMKYVSSSAREEIQHEIDIVSEYLPKQLSTIEVEQIVLQIKSELGYENSIPRKEMGKVIKAVKSKVGDSSDGQTISSIVKEYVE